MSDIPAKFYLTTPIYYVNARPHIGHAYSTIAADVIARRHRLLGDDTFFLTGTDEHGQKVQRSAEKAGIPPQQFADEVSATFESLWKRMGITNDDYIRTTDERHKRGVQKLWRTLEERGAIYLSTYTGQYSVGEEMFIDGPPGTIGPDGKPTETVTEENYFFKLSEYQQPLIDLIESDDPDAPLRIKPDAIRNEVLSFLRGNWMSEIHAQFPAAENHLKELNGSKPTVEEVAQFIDSAGSMWHGEAKRSSAGNFYIPGALKDLSISRTTFDWGIKVPGNEKHVVYVWLDALANYITAIGYGSDDPADIAKFAKYWPADLHLVGKEITRFHCVYWPAFLLAAGLPLPKSVVANGWLLFEESKMSKSRGNVVRTETILDAFGPLCPPCLSSRSEAEGSASPEQPTKTQQDLFASDVIRYFLLREIPFGQDGSFSFDALITRYNADLANGYGNLVSRTFAMVEKYFDGVIPKGSACEAEPSFQNTQLFDRFVNNNPSGVWNVHLPGEAIGLVHAFGINIGQFHFNRALEAYSEFIRMLDSYITSRSPWKAIVGLTEAEMTEKRGDVLYTAAESIRIITALLYPVMPYATASVWRQLGLGSIEEAARKGELKNLKWGGLKPGTKLGPLAPIFPRADKGLAQIMIDMENPAPPAPTPEPVIPAQPAADSVLAPSPENAPAAAESTPITIDDFVKVDLRVGQIVVAERIPKADKLLRLEVDLGPTLGRRQILSGIAEWYTPEELIGRRIAVIANLAPRKMRGLESHGMLLAASADDHASKPILANFSDEVSLGSRIR
jgi:methionyl-tRNA synthetase